MDKIIAVGIIFAMVTMIVAAIFFATIPSMPAIAPVISSVPLDVSSFQQDESMLNSYGSDVALFNKEEAVFLEMDETFNDILNITETAFDENSISKEAADADYSADPKSFNDNEAVLKEADQAFLEISQ